jgi:hypothetical protein
MPKFSKKSLFFLIILLVVVSVVALLYKPIKETFVEGANKFKKNQKNAKAAKVASALNTNMAPETTTMAPETTTMAPFEPETTKDSQTVNFEEKFSMYYN